MLSQITRTRCAASVGKALCASAMRIVSSIRYFPLEYRSPCAKPSSPRRLSASISKVRIETGKTHLREHQIFCERAIDNLEDMIDLFWEQPFAFATFVYHRYPDELTDAFSSRIYPTERQPSPAILAFRKLLKRTREYDKDDYSVPIGSRYHPERAAIWEPNSPVGTTEQWLGAR